MEREMEGPIKLESFKGGKQQSKQLTRPIHWVSKCISNFTQDFQNTVELISSLQTIHIPVQKSWICRHFDFESPA